MSDSENKKRTTSEWIKDAYNNRSEEDKAIYKEKKRLASLASWSDPVIRAKRLAAMKEARENPEKNKRFRDAILLSNKNPEHIEKRKKGNANRSEDDKKAQAEKNSIAMKSAWQDAEKRKHIEDGISKAYACPILSKERDERAKNLQKSPNWKTRMEECLSDPEWKKNFSEKVKAANTEEMLKRRGEAIKKAMSSPEYKVKDDERIQKGFDTKMQKYGTASTQSIAGINGTIREEDKFRNWLNSFGNNFSPYKIPGQPFILDGYDPNLKLAFEYCGLYWHNENSPTPRNATYHKSKMVACNKLGIRLITVFEDEWINRESQVKSFLKAVIGKCSRRIFARKCTLGKIQKCEAKAFHNSYHIQGGDNSEHNYGIFIENELIGVMSIGKHHRNMEGMVLTRLSFKDDCTVVGGASRLFKYAVSDLSLNSVISWSDNRWSEGGVYKSIGFFLEAELRPDYTYVPSDGSYVKKRLSKQSQKKSSTGCPKDKTELQWSKERGLSRIWDCGKKRWKWTKEKPQ